MEFMVRAMNYGNLVGNLDIGVAELLDVFSDEPLFKSWLHVRVIKKNLSLFVSQLWQIKWQYMILAKKVYGFYQITIQRRWEI